jgi:CheY-like chemotaxis protein
MPMLRRTLGATIGINFVPGQDLWGCEADQGQLENAIVNLALNGRDAMAGGGMLTIETSNVELDADYAAAHAELAPGSYVKIAVSDTGCGMSRETLERAFEPFYTTKGVGKGSGLGLSMVFGFIKQSRGHVNIYSELGHGTTVKLYLPRLTKNPSPPVAAFAGFGTPSGNETILVVEDDAAMRDLAVKFLRGFGYETLEARTGAEALAILDDHDEVDAVLTDVVLPGGMNGPQIAAAMRLRRPQLKFLYMSGYTDNAIVHNGRLDRGVDLLQKPFRQRELGEKLRAVLDREGV